MSNMAINEATRDLIIGRSVARVAGIEYTAQLVHARLETILGEWKQDTNLGIDWVAMLGRKAPLQEIERKTRKLLTETNGVSAVTSLVITPNYRTRKLQIHFELVSELGIISDTIYT